MAAECKDRKAIIAGEHEEYRYHLGCTWDAARPRLLWVLLNPSIADDTTDDQTLRRCTRFSHDWEEYGGLEIVNLFAFRATDPRDLQRAPDPIGPENDWYVAEAASRATRIIVAWGERGTYQQRDRKVRELLARHTAQQPYCFGLTRNGCPRHPLRLARGTPLVPYTGP